MRKRSSLWRSIMSTHQLVVKAVIALSALEKLAATIPIVNNITTIVPRLPEAANIGNKLSLISGSEMPCLFASIINKMPRERNNRFAGRNAKP